MKKPKSGIAIINEAVRRAERRQRRKLALTENILVNKMPAEAVLHFWDNNQQNGHFSNLVVCPSKGYSDMLHEEVLKRFSSYQEFIKSRARFRKDLKRERIARRFDYKPLWEP